jgi:hypothetical protein
MKKKPTENEMIKIALESFLCLATVKKVYRGSGHRNSRQRVEQTAKRLGLPLPEAK